MLNLELRPNWRDSLFPVADLELSPQFAYRLGGEEDYRLAPRFRIGEAEILKLLPGTDGVATLDLARDDLNALHDSFLPLLMLLAVSGGGAEVNSASSREGQA